MVQWTEERRKKQAEAIKRWKPWEKSTGPKSPKGKARASRNAYRHGNRSKHKERVRRCRLVNQAFLAHLKAHFLQMSSEYAKQTNYSKTLKNQSDKKTIKEK